MDLLPHSGSLHPVGHGCHVSGKTVFDDLSFCHGWWIFAGNHFPTHTLCQQEIFTQGNSTATLATNRTYPLCSILRNFRHTNDGSEGDCTLYTAVIHLRGEW